MLDKLSDFLFGDPGDKITKVGITTPGSAFIQASEVCFIWRTPDRNSLVSEMTPSDVKRKDTGYRFCSP